MKSIHKRPVASRLQVDSCCCSGRCFHLLGQSSSRQSRCPDRPRVDGDTGSWSPLQGTLKKNRFITFNLFGQGPKVGNFMKIWLVCWISRLLFRDSRPLHVFADMGQSTKELFVIVRVPVRTLSDPSESPSIRLPHKGGKFPCSIRKESQVKTRGHVSTEHIHNKGIQYQIKVIASNTIQYKYSNRHAPCSKYLGRTLISNSRGLRIRHERP